MKKHALWLILGVMVSGAVSAEELPLGQLIDDVQCQEDGSQRYALYVPSTFTPLRLWPVIFVFDPGGHGRTGVERYQAAAEKYGYIVAGSNNSRNGPVQNSLIAAMAMAADVDDRFPLNRERIYTAGMSGGARVAMRLALNFELISGPAGPGVAGVLASSAGFPNGTSFRESVPFPIFGTAGTDDFNHREMSRLERDLISPHRVEVFEGGHTWLPVDLATDGIEWMEIQAMRRGLRPRDPKLVDEIFAKRIARGDAQRSSLEKLRELKSVAIDFKGLKDVAGLAERAAMLEQQQDVKEALTAERSEEERELQITREVYQLRDRLATNNGFATLKERVTTLLSQSRAAEDSPDRRIARRVLTGLRASSGGVRNPEFQELMNQIRSSGQPVLPQ
jgi:pimeloyl-ACP methyl ester carboxylesterase